MIFYLGTHRPNWLAQTSVPLFVSRRTMPSGPARWRALGQWALDSGGFTELNMHGRWVTSPETYVGEVRRWADEVGGLDWAAVQDWMCESVVLAKTGLTIEEHQRRSVESWRRLTDLAPDLPWAPVLQGWTADDYLRCADAYQAAGLDWSRAPVVGVGTMCRRQATTAAVLILGRVVRDLADRGARGAHAFGFKAQGLRAAAALGIPLASADSLAWSYRARRSEPLEGCEGHINCANCLTYALAWRERLLGDSAA